MATEPSNGLCLIADVKTALGIAAAETTQDYNVAAYIEAACDDIAVLLGRSFLTASHTEYFKVLVPTDVLYVRNLPITAITSVTDGWDVQSASGTVLTADTDYFVESLGRGKLVRIGAQWATGRRAVKVVYAGGYATQSTVPEGLKQAAVEATLFLWHQGKLGDGRFGLSGKAGGGGGVTGFSADYPPNLTSRLMKYRTARGWFG